MNYGFRPASDCDSEKILGLYDLVRDQPYCAWDAEYPSLREIAADLAEGHIFVLTDGERIIGAASVSAENESDDLSLWRYRDAAGEIARVCISPDCQGKGLGKSVVQETVGAMRRLGYKSVHLLAAAENPAALGLYRSLGFTECGPCRMFDIDFIAFEKLL